MTGVVGGDGSSSATIASLLAGAVRRAGGLIACVAATAAVAQPSRQAPPAGAAPDPIALRAAVDADLARSWPHLFDLYKDIHSHPELGFQERRTAALLAREMRSIGFQVTDKVGGTGIVALYRNGDGPTILVRTELDALPLKEETGLPYASTVETMWSEPPATLLSSSAPTPAPPSPERRTFVAHACGHDVHMAWWVGTARALLALKARWHGTLMFVAQPAEETVSGAKAMLADGLFTRFPKPDFGFAAHVAAMPAGTIMVKDGVASSMVDNVEIVFRGRGGHGALPSTTIDPVVIAAHFVSDLQSIVSREKDATLPGVITVGSFQAGTTGNVIPDTADLKMTLRSFSPAVRAQLLAGVQRVANAAAAMAAAPGPRISLLSGTSSVVNDSRLVARITLVLKAIFGDGVHYIPPTVGGDVGSEDYSEFIAAGVPSVFFAVGGTSPRAIADYAAKGEVPPRNHSPGYAPDPEASIKTGVIALTLAVLSVTGRTPVMR